MATYRETWEEMERPAQLRLAFGFFFFVAFTAAAAWWLLRDEQRVLLSDLEPQAASAVVAELERLKAPYEIDAGGRQILVPASQVDELRVRLAGADLPIGGGSGFEIFDESEFGMTEFAQRINYQRAMQGELARTIMSLREIRHARVHLVMPEDRLFGRGDRVPSAAVNVVLHRNAVLSDEQVLGIQRLVSSSVEGLSHANVTIVDQNGVTLSRGGADSEPGGAGMVDVRLQKKRDVERYLQDKVDTVLARSLGTGVAIVSVDVSLRMDEVRTTRQEPVTTADGRGWVKRTRETRNWTSGDAPGGDGGETTETEYDLGRRVEEIVAPPGAIERLSVGVLLPDAVYASEAEEIREIVAMTVGYSTARGDSIAVHAIDEVVASAAGGLAVPFDGAFAGAPAAGRSAPEWPAALPVERTAPADAGPGVWGRIRALPLFAGWSEPAVAAALALCAVPFALALGLAGRRFARRTRDGGLSGDERRELLEELRGWLDADAAEVDEGTSA